MTAKWLYMSVHHHCRPSFSKYQVGPLKDQQKVPKRRNTEDRRPSYFTLAELNGRRPIQRPPADCAVAAAWYVRLRAHTYARGMEDNDDETCMNSHSRADIHGLSAVTFYNSAERWSLGIINERHTSLYVYIFTLVIFCRVVVVFLFHWMSAPSPSLQ